MENIRYHRDIKLVIIEAKINYLLREPSYQTTKVLENLLVVEI